METFLEKCELSHAIETFNEHNIKFDHIEHINEEYLKELLPRIGDRINFKLGVEKENLKRSMVNSDDEGPASKKVARNRATMLESSRKPAGKKLERRNIGRVTKAKARSQPNKKLEVIQILKSGAVNHLLESINKLMKKHFPKLDIRHLMTTDFWINVDTGVLNCIFCPVTTSVMIRWGAKKEKNYFNPGNYERHLLQAHSSLLGVTIEEQKNHIRATNNEQMMIHEPIVLIEEGDNVEVEKDVVKEDEHEDVAKEKEDEAEVEDDDAEVDGTETEKLPVNDEPEKQTDVDGKLEDDDTETEKLPVNAEPEKQTDVEKEDKVEEDEAKENADDAEVENVDSESEDDDGTETEKLPVNDEPEKQTDVDGKLEDDDTETEKLPVNAEPEKQTDVEKEDKVEEDEDDDEVKENADDAEVENVDSESEDDDGTETEKLPVNDEPEKQTDVEKEDKVEEDEAKEKENADDAEVENVDSESKDDDAEVDGTETEKLRVNDEPEKQTDVEEEHEVEEKEDVDAELEDDDAEVGENVVKEKDAVAEVEEDAAKENNNDEVDDVDGKLDDDDTETEKLHVNAETEKHTDVDSELKEDEVKDGEHEDEAKEKEDEADVEEDDAETEKLSEYVDVEMEKLADNVDGNANVNTVLESLLFSCVDAGDEIDLNSNDNFRLELFGGDLLTEPKNTAVSMSINQGENSFASQNLFENNLTAGPAAQPSVSDSLKAKKRVIQKADDENAEWRKTDTKFVWVKFDPREAWKPAFLYPDGLAQYVTKSSQLSELKYPITEFDEKLSQSKKRTFKAALTKFNKRNGCSFE